MNRLTTLILCLWTALAVNGQDSLVIKLDSLLSHPMFQTTQVGLMVYDLTADSVLYERNARQLMRPASTMKVVTAITALDRLGSDYAYRTRICHTGTLANGRLNGDLYCVGGFDPTLTTDDIKAMAESLHQQGVDTLQGNVIADLTMKEALDYGEGWCWDDKNPLLTPLSVGRKNNFLNQLVQEMANDSIVLIDTNIMESRCPDDATLLTTCQHSIDQILLRMMKNSDNFYAESMFYQIAAHVAGQCTAKASDGRQAIKQLIRKIGLNADSYRFADGSGLSLYNYVSAELETMLLRYAWRNQRIYAHLYPAMPIAGEDGTLEKRMKGEFTQGNVHAKTGTLTGISSLAGYCTAFNTHQLAFCIINQGVMRNQDGKDFQDRVCAVLCEP